MKPITPREYQIACLLAEGMRPLDIAHKLDIATSTVRRQITAAYLKLGISGMGAMRQLRSQRNLLCPHHYAMQNGDTCPGCKRRMVRNTEMVG